MEIEGKVALVTGSARRIGASIAMALARGGADVALHYRTSREQARRLAENIAAAGKRAELFQADLAQADQIASMFRAVAEKFPRLDILVNSAAVYQRTPIETLSAEQWDAAQAVNARAPALCIRHAIPLMRRGGGSIVNITDILAEKTSPGYPAYCAAKAALVALTKSAAKALAGRNIRVNSVAPGVIAWQEDITDDQKRRVLEQIPMKRVGSPEDIASAVIFLVQNDYITAQNIHVDGGWHMG